MKTNEMNDGNIYIQNFTFNRKLRILQHAEEVIQLRKKEADVLALLCDKYPNPVSQNDFLTKVWGGGYVTSQSIAQVIRSLRLSLGDKKKSIISTIPKLGYKLTVTPVYEDVLPTKFQYGEVIKLGHDCDEFSYAEQQTAINLIPSTTSISIIPYTQDRKKFFSARKLMFSSAILIFGSLVGVTLSARSVPADSSELHDIQEPPLLVTRQKNMTEEDNVYVVQCNNTIIDLLKGNKINNCFVD